MMENDIDNHKGTKGTKSLVMSIYGGKDIANHKGTKGTKGLVMSIRISV